MLMFMHHGTCAKFSAARDLVQSCFATRTLVIPLSGSGLHAPSMSFCHAESRDRLQVSGFNALDYEADQASPGANTC